MTTPDLVAAPLTVAENDLLVMCEETISRGFQTFVEVGNALADVRDNRLYRVAFATFENYCQERWGFTYQRAHQLISAASLVSTIVETGLPAPTNEGQARELAKVPESERADVWTEAVKKTEGKPTAAAVKEIREERSAPVGSPPRSYPAPQPEQPRIRPIDRPTFGPRQEPEPESPADLVGSAITAMKQGQPVVPEQDYAPWRTKFTAAISGAGRLVEFSDEDIIAFASDSLVAEMALMIETLSAKHARVAAARAVPNNVFKLRAV